MVEKYCKVILIQKSRYIDKKFTYKTYLDVCLGQIVYVPFGRGNKQLEAIIVEIQEKLPCDEDKLKEIVSLGEKTNLDYDKIALAFWIISFSFFFYNFRHSRFSWAEFCHYTSFGKSSRKRQ